MALIRKNYSDIIDSALRQLTQETTITQLSPGAKARALLEIVSRQISEQYQIFDLNLANAFLSTARGEFLNYIGEIVGLERLQPVTAGTVSGSQNVIFYTFASTFGAINGGSDITIPKGTRIWTSPSTSEADDSVYFYVTEQVVLPAAANTQAIPVNATQQGDISNVGQDTLVNHDFENYSDFENGTLLVRNRASITSGRGLESDEDFRYRISKQVTASEMGNETAIRLAALSVPGVADVSMVPYVRGLGTFAVYIKSLEARVSDELVDAVQQTIDEVQSFGNRGYALKPKEIGIEMVLSLTYRESITSRDRASINRDVVGAMYDYINNLDIGEDFIVNEVVQRVMQVDDRIKNVGVANKPIDELRMWKTSRTVDNRIRYTLESDYTTAFDEKVLVEYSLTTPVTIINK
jgi:uncharacterized phage protein gp47/JayE